VLLVLGDLPSSSGWNLLLCSALQPLMTLDHSGYHGPISFCRNTQSPTTTTTTSMTETPPSTTRG
jgi:hypothetical protein